MCHLLVRQAVHIGDSLRSDVQGGINAGLAATVWVNRHGAELRLGDPHPTFTVRHVTELPDCLRQLRQRKRS
jgi:N-acylneuraminate-9-phosphatase